MYNRPGGYGSPGDMLLKTLGGQVQAPNLSACRNSAKSPAGSRTTHPEHVLPSYHHYPPPTPPCHPQTGPGVSLLLSLFGIAMGYLSTFWAFGYTRLSRRMFRFLDTGSPRIRRYDVIGTLEKVGLLGLRGGWVLAAE